MTKNSFGTARIFPFFWPSFLPTSYCFSLYFIYPRLSSPSLLSFSLFTFVVPSNLFQFPPFLSASLIRGLSSIIPTFLSHHLSLLTSLFFLPSFLLICPCLVSPRHHHPRLPAHSPSPPDRLPPHNLHNNLHILHFRSTSSSTQG